MTRDVQLARIPVFQFGVFSDGDLSYFSSVIFNMAGRVHTNGNLFLASGDSTTGLVFHSRITAAGEVIRQELANGESTSPSLLQPVLIPTAPNGCQGSRPACRDLQETEGSKTGGPASSDVDAWTNLSETTYNGMILNADTGAKALKLPFVNSGKRPIELIRRPPSGESATSLLGKSRLYNQAQIRVFLNDSAAGLPGGVGVQLVGGSWGPDNISFADGSSPEVDGYLLVQGRQSDQTYANVTTEWLTLGIAREDTDAILKFQAIHEHGTPSGSPAHPHPQGNEDRYDQLVLYDTREGEPRNVVPDTQCALGGIMNFIELDVKNLGHWLAGTIGTTGTNVESTSQNGYLFYFSDRRGMLGDPGESGVLMGEYGFEDVVNPKSSTGAPNGKLDAAEDVDESGALDTYGAGNIGTGFGVGNGDPTVRINCDSAWYNRASGARHALKLINGTGGDLPSPGFTVGSENPVYVEGDYNANAGFGGTHVPAAIIADAVTFLSNNWQDWRSVVWPNVAASRLATSTWYRVAVVAGKNKNWDHPVWSSNAQDGQDGGVRYLVRSLERWSIFQSFNYMGSLVSLFHSEYAVGTYKCCDTVFTLTYPSFTFDTDFLDSTKLPPATPRLQDLVTLGYRQVF